MSVTLDHQLVGFIEQVNIAIAEAKASGVVATPELAREKLAALAAFVTQKPDVANVIDSSLDTGSHLIPVRIYQPEPEQVLPVLVYFHGGGGMCGDIELYDPMCRKIALAGNCIVISVAYRLAPEFPYPCGLEDAEFVVKNYRLLLTELNYSSELYIAGDSAGGAICTSLTSKQVNDPELTFSKQILIYPSVDYTMSSSSVEELGVGYFLEKARIKWYFDNYFLNGEDRKAVSALFNPVNNQSPKSLVLTAECDPLKDEGRAYANKLKEAGVEVETHEFAGMIHAFMNIEDLVPEQNKLLFSKIGEFIKS